MEFYTTLGTYVQGELERLSRLHEANIPERGVISRVLCPSKMQDKKTNRDAFSVTHEVPYLELDYLGIVGDRHQRAVRGSTAREKNVYPKGEMIRQHRHVFAVSEYDCRVLSERMELDVTPELLGANVVIEREDKQNYSLSKLPQGTYLLIGTALAYEASIPPLATLVKYATQQGCPITGNVIRRAYGADEEITRTFVEVSAENRGIVCGVEYPVEHKVRLEAGQKVFFNFATGVCP